MLVSARVVRAIDCNCDIKALFTAENVVFIEMILFHCLNDIDTLFCLEDVDFVACKAGNENQKYDAADRSYSRWQHVAAFIQ